jgi:hypothetical protein
MRFRKIEWKCNLYPEDGSSAVSDGAQTRQVRNCRRQVATLLGYSALDSR